MKKEKVDIEAEIIKSCIRCAIEMIATKDYFIDVEIDENGDVNIIIDDDKPLDQVV